MIISLDIFHNDKKRWVELSSDTLREIEQAAFDVLSRNPDFSAEELTVECVDPFPVDEDTRYLFSAKGYA